MMEVNKASAGSGKTYTLAHTYIDLLKDDLAYRHILAVTFTNKATAEMKERILLYLSEDPARRRKLIRILHDYSAFAVSTIDRFFQRALKAFAREIGQVADYQVELDRETLIAEAMDRILDSLTTDGSQEEIIGWLRENIASRLESGSGPNIERSLHDMGLKLGSDERRRLRAEHGITDEEFSKERLARVRRSCREIIRRFASDVKAAAADLPEYGNKHADKQRGEYMRSVWYKPIDYPKKSLAAKAAGTPFMDLFDRQYRIYRTARLVEAQVFSLGLAREFFARFEEVLHDKNVLSLDDSNTLLSRIISGSDAPFVYEKLGVRYEHFLLDEFQDTSNIQWDNFLPLLRESDSNGRGSLIVGDIKQSIYRWRDSDWRLLAEKVEKEFPGARVKSMQDNRRSCREIVLFNNGFFSFAAKQLGLESIYSDVEQNPLSEDRSQPGFVQVSFCPKEEEIPKVLASVEKALDSGALYKDIAVIVRNNAEGSAVAAKLISGGYPVVSDDSLRISASFTVRRLLGLLSSLENPEDSLGAFIAQDARVEFPSEYHSLVGLCEDLLRQLKAMNPDVFADETLFVEAFMDELREWTEVNGNNLRYFLQHWHEKPRYISSPENANAITILTVHKAKGLEFPYLIFPFAEKVNIYKHCERWCWLDVSGTPFDPAVSGIYPVDLSEKTADTLFAEAYEQERAMQRVDNMNVFYVALTRAKCCLHIIAENPPESFKPGNYGNFSQIVYEYCGQRSQTEYGRMYDFTLLKRKPGRAGADFPAGYATIPIGGRLEASEDAYDYFGPEGEVGIDASPRRNGVVLHGILARIRRADDLPEAIKDAVLGGLLDEKQAADARDLLSARIAAHPEFFEGGGYNEASVIGSDGSDNRPDRVIVRGDKAIVIDYKFGAPEPRHFRQVGGYMQLYRELGYSEVEGWLWYVPSDTFRKVQ